MSATATLPAEVSAALDEVDKGLNDKFATKADSQNLLNELNSLKAETQKSLGEIKASIKVSDPNQIEDPKWGFKSFGDFAGALKNYVTNKSLDERFKAIKAPSTYAGEAIGADGGFLVAPEFNRELLRFATSEASLLSRTRRIITNGNSITIPKDETTPWGSSGVLAYWTKEADGSILSKPKIGETGVPLHKLSVLVPVTNELLEDSFIGLGQYLGQVAPDAINTKVNTAIVSGTGVGQPLGYRLSGARITVSKTSGQAAGTFTAANALTMLSRLQKSGSNGATWLYNPTVLPQLGTMTIGQQPVWLPGPGRTADGPLPSSLFGIPALECMDCSVLSAAGDVELVDFSKYVTVTKSTGIRSDMSIHLYFDQDVSAFRFVFRIGGQPWQQAPITLKDGSTTQSPFVNLEAR